jgi:hypothetical protein
MEHTRTSREQWQERIRRFEASGLSGAAYARKHGIAPGTLSWWRWKLRPEGQSPRRRRRRWRAAEFVELSASALAATSGERFELEVGDVTLRIPADFDEASLGRVLGVVRGAR